MITCIWTSIAELFSVKLPTTVLFVENVDFLTLLYDIHAIESASSLTPQPRSCRCKPITVIHFKFYLFLFLTVYISVRHQLQLPIFDGQNTLCSTAYRPIIIYTMGHKKVPLRFFALTPLVLPAI